MQESYTSESAKASGAQMSVEDIGKLNRKHKRQPEQFAQEIMAHIQTKADSPVSPWGTFETDRRPSGFQGIVQLVHDFGRETPVPFYNEAPEIPVSILPEPYATFARELAESTQTPAEMGIMLILSCIAASVQGKWEVYRDDSDHTEPLCFWGFVVMLSGENKTAVFKEVTSPLRDWEKRLAEQTKQQDAERNAKARIQKARARKLENPEEGKSDEDKAKEIAEAELKGQDKAPGRQIWTGDVTPEKMQDLLCDNEERMALIADEAGFIDTLTGLYNKGNANFDVFMQAYSNSPCKVDRQGRSVELNDPHLSIGTTFQPKVLSALKSATGSKSHLVEKGFLGRTAIVAPESKVGFRDVRSKKRMQASTRAAYQQALTALLSLTYNYKNSPEVANKSKYRIKPNRTAEERWQDAWQFLEDNQGRPDRMFEPIGTWTRKAHGLMLRVAGLLHVAKYGIEAKDRDIDLETMNSAIRFCMLLIPHIRKAFALAGIGEGEKCWEDAEYILSYLVSHNLSEFSETDIHKLNRFKNSEKARLARAFSVLRSHFILSDQKTETRSSGKPRIYRRVHPAIVPPISKGNSGLAGLSSETPTELDRLPEPPLD